MAEKAVILLGLLTIAVAAVSAQKSEDHVGNNKTSIWCYSCDTKEACAKTVECHPPHQCYSAYLRNDMGKMFLKRGCTNMTRELEFDSMSSTVCFTAMGQRVCYPTCGKSFCNEQYPDWQVAKASTLQQSSPFVAILVAAMLVLVACQLI